jgi:putative cell wall-binding protein
MHYFSYISHSYSLKNKLEKSILALLKEHQRMVIKEEDVENFKKTILQKIEILNQQHLNCTPKKDVQFTTHDYNDFTLSGIHFVPFHLYKSKN